MNKYKFKYKKGYNYYILIANNINDGLQIIKNYLNNKYPGYNHYISRNDFNITKLDINFVEKHNTILEVADKNYIMAEHRIHNCERSPYYHSSYYDKY